MENFNPASVLGYGPISSGISSGKIKAVLLTGSRSLGVQGENSDYDFAVYFDSHDDKILTKIPPFITSNGEKISFVKNSSFDLNRLFSDDRMFEGWVGVQFLLPVFSSQNVIYSSDPSLLQRSDIDQIFSATESSIFRMLRDRYMEKSASGSIVGYQNSRRIIWALAIDSVRGRLSQNAGIPEARRQLMSSTAPNYVEAGAEPEILRDPQVLAILNSINSRQ